MNVKRNPGIRQMRACKRNEDDFYWMLRDENGTDIAESLEEEDAKAIAHAFNLVYGKKEGC